jgi:hypothetical protein
MTNSALVKRTLIMKNRKYLIAIATTLSLFCSPSLNAETSQTAQQKYETLKNRYESEEFKAINQKMPFKSIDATLAQLSDTSKATKKEKDILDAWLKVQRDYVNDAMLDANKNQPYLTNILQEKINSEENIYIQLYQGKMNYGDANKARKTLSIEVSEKVRNAMNQSQQAQVQEQQRREKQLQLNSQKQEQCNVYKNYLSQLSESKNNGLGNFSAELSVTTGDPSSWAANRAMRDEQVRKRDELIIKYQTLIATTCGG